MAEPGKCTIQTKIDILTLFSVFIVSLFISGCVAPPSVKIKEGTKALLTTKQDYTKELIKLNTRSDVTQKFLLFRPKNPIASVILFPGGNGKLSLADSGLINSNKNNLVVRIKEDLAKAGFMVALVDAPSDKWFSGLHFGSFRCTSSHFQDMRKVVNYLKGQKDIPTWLFGFSMGNHSAAYLASLFKDNIDGLIIASSVTNWAVINVPVYKDYPDGILNIDLDLVSVPTLIVHHAKDYCKLCPSTRVPEIKKALVNSPKVEIKYITGGHTHANPCGPLGHHGYGGKEKEALRAIVGFIKSNSK